MHTSSKHQGFSFLTQFLPTWVKKWCLLPILSTFLYVIGRFMPWEHPWLYPIHTILLVQPIWMACIWPLWTWFVGRRLQTGLKWGTMAVSMLGMVWSMGVFAPPQHMSGTQVLIANVNAYAGEQDMLQGYLSMIGIPRIVLLEKRAEEIGGMKRAADDFDTVVKKPSHHSAVFCAEKCTAWVSPQIGSGTMAMSLVVMPLPEQMCLIAVQIPPPTPIDATGMRPYVEYIESVVKSGRLLRDWEGCSQSDAVIVAGDYNAVSGSWAHKQLMSLGLQDAQRSTGLSGATWPAEAKDFLQLPLFRIDHVLHHPDIKVGVQQVRIPHSDHQGLLLSIDS
jgi:endonuclease/exonuclease/phosphatase (EEP) superfamily protein YafD